MLHRTKDPNKGKWNGVGGKIEPGETPLDACVREVREETGLRVRNVTLRGIATFNDESGMYIFTAESTSGEPTACPEGKLEWKSLLWILTSPDVAVTVPHFLPEVLGTNPPLEHAFTFADNGELLDYTVRELHSDELVLAHRGKQGLHATKTSML
jgi:8-oxo-dGTP diphosphatase